MLLFWCSALVFAEPTRPHTVWAQLHEARLLSEFEKEHEEAISIYDALLEGLEPSEFSYGELWYWKGLAYLHIEEYDLAIAAFELSNSNVTYSARSIQAMEEALVLKHRVLSLPSLHNPWVSLNANNSIWGMGVDASASVIQGFELNIRTMESVVSIQIQIEAWDGRIWGHAVNLIEGDSVMPLRFNQLRPAVPEGTKIRGVRLSGQTPAGIPAKVEILGASVY